MRKRNLKAWCGGFCLAAAFLVIASLAYFMSSMDVSALREFRDKLARREAITLGELTYPIPHDDQGIDHERLVEDFVSKLGMSEVDARALVVAYPDVVRIKPTTN